MCLLAPSRGGEEAKVSLSWKIITLTFFSVSYCQLLRREDCEVALRFAIYLMSYFIRSFSPAALFKQDSVFA